ncbi:MAG TPA: CBS domain-containing protein [Gammaproteobacteria bacterium]|nr:CBS domain-containing protein [Gammaproteobacteria bacterium]
MSLRWYKRRRLVVLKPDTPVLEAARAIESNRIGAIVVQDKGRVVGIVTDRDLAVRALGRGLDAQTTALADVMSTPPLTLTPADDRGDALQLMQEYNIRRIPLVEDERIVGIVTLDDLLLDQSAPLDDLTAVVQAQIGDGGPAESPRTPARQRGAARAVASFRRLLKQVQEKASLDNIDQAETALLVVLRMTLQRLTPNEASDLVAQLPSMLQDALRMVPPGPDKTITRGAIEAELGARLDVGPERASTMIDAIGAAVCTQVSDGQMEDVRNQLPAELRSIYTPARPGL